MGNSPAPDSDSQEWTGSVTFGGQRRRANFFSTQFGIGGTIVEACSVRYNTAVIIVNKVIYYGIRLIIYDDRYNDSNRSESDLYECIKLTSWDGVNQEDIDAIIQFVQTAFANPTNDGTWRMLENKFHLTSPCPYRRIKREFAQISELLRNNELSKLRKADILVIQRSVYHHYGIFIGGNAKQKIVNVGHKGLNGGAGVETTSFETFVASSKIMYVEYKLIEMSSSDEIVNKAKEFANKNLYHEMYNLLWRNCEHFARGLADASPNQLNDPSFEPNGSSSQVKNGSSLALLALTAIAGIGVAAVGGSNNNNNNNQDSDDDGDYTM